MSRYLHHLCYRPLSRRLDRCDRVIHNESGDPNGGNMCSFSGATCTSRDVTMQITFLIRKSALIYRRNLRQRVASLTLNCNGVLAIRAYSDALTNYGVLNVGLDSLCCTVVVFFVRSVTHATLPSAQCKCQRPVLHNYAERRVSLLTRTLDKCKSKCIH